MRVQQKQSEFEVLRNFIFQFQQEATLGNKTQIQKWRINLECGKYLKYVENINFKKECFNGRARFLDLHFKGVAILNESES